MSLRVALYGKVKPVGGAEAKASANSASSRAGQTRSWVIYPWPGRTPGNTGRRAAPVTVEKVSDELWMGAKDQSNLVIAGSLRNSFRASLGGSRIGGRATVWRRVPTGIPKPAELRIPNAVRAGSQTAGDKLRRRKGNSPDRRSRPPMVRLVDCKDVAPH